MLKISVVLILATTSFSVSVEGLKCHQGFNASIAGVPFYFWNEKECRGRSKCFTQEMKMKVPKTHLEVGLRYGGCITRSYSHLLTCEKLFDKDSDLDPAAVFNMLPGIEDKYNAVIQEFYQNITEGYRALLSDGNGTSSFIDGCYTLMEDLGFNMEKALPLKSHFTDLLNATLPYPFRAGGFDYGYYYNLFDQSLEEKRLAHYESLYNHTSEVIDGLLEAIGKLDTKETKISSQIYSFLGNFMNNRVIIELHSSKFTPLIDNLPGLIKSMLPESFKADHWYDDLFKIVGNINKFHSKDSAITIMKIMKKFVKIPEEYKKFTDPIEKNGPTIIEQLVEGNYESAFDWSVKLLSAESARNEKTKRLSKAISTFYTRISNLTLDGKFDLIAEWAPGLLYNIFPGGKKEIDRIYDALSEGLEETDFENPSSTMKESEMSKFIIFVAEKFLFTMTDLNRTMTKQDFKLIVINFSRVVYKALPDYQEQIDKIFSTLSDGFKDWPEFDAGKITIQMLKKFNLEIPTPVKLLLDHLQSLISPWYSDGPRNDTVLLEKILNATDLALQDYKSEYPESEFIDLARQGHDILKNMSVDFLKPDCYFSYRFEDDKLMDCYRQRSAYLAEMSERSFNLFVDIYFAIFNELNVNTQFFYKAMEQAFPDYKIYVHVMKALDRSDIKLFYQDYQEMMGDIRVLSTPFQRIVWTFYRSVENLFSKLKDVMGEIRTAITPDSCKYEACRVDLCNTHESVTAKKPYTAKPDPIKNDSKNKANPTVEPTTTTTSASSKVYASVTVNILMIWIFRKML